METISYEHLNLTVISGFRQYLVLMTIKPVNSYAAADVILVMLVGFGCQVRQLVVNRIQRSQFVYTN